MASLVTTTVNGNLTIAGNSASDSHNVVFSDTGGEEWYIEYNGGLRFVESGAAQRFIIADGGNATFQQNLTINTRLTFSGGSSQYLEVGTNSIALKNSGGAILWNSSTSITNPVDGHLDLYGANTLQGIGFNRDVSSGAIYNSGVYAYQIHSNASQFQIQRYNGSGTFLGYGLVINTGGNVGMGTETPYRNAHIYQAADGNNYEGALQVGGNSASLGGYFGYNSTSSGRLTISSLNNTGGANAKIFLGFGLDGDGSPATEVMTLTQGGSVGIGQSAPIKPLHIKAASPYTVYEDTDDNEIWLTGIGGNTYNIYEDVGGTHTWRASFTTDGLKVAANAYILNSAGIKQIRFKSTEVAFNEDGRSDVDVRMEGDTDANLFFLDASTDKIGIGTDAPSCLLQLSTTSVQGNALLSIRRNGDAINFGHSNGAGYGSVIGCSVNNGFPHLGFMCEAGTNNNTFRTRGLKGNVIYTNTSGELKFAQITTATADNQTPTDRLTIDSSGNVTQAGGAYEWYDGSGAKVGEISTLGGNNLTISGTQTNHCGLSFATNAILPATQSATNNNTVDLGANGNAFKDFYIQGTAYVRNSGGNNILWGKGTGWGYSPNSYKAIQIGDASGNFTVSIGYDPAGNTSGAFTGDGTELLFKNDFSFVTPNAANNGWHYCMHFKDGNVGIGTVTPGSLLSVSGNSDDGDGACTIAINDEDSTVGSKIPAIQFYGGGTTTGRIRGGDAAFSIAVGSSPTTALNINTANGYPSFTYGSQVRLTLGSTGTAETNNANWVRANGANLEFNAASGDFNWEVGGAHKMRLTDSGYLGIGLGAGTDPFAQLHVNGTNGSNIHITRTSGGTTSTFGSIIFGNTNIDSSCAEITGDQDGATDSGRLEFGTQASVVGGVVTRMTIKSDGNVGIGTASPAALLHVGGAAASPHAAADDFVIAPAATDVGMTIRCNSNSGTGSIFFADTAGNAQGTVRYNHNTDYMSFSSSGDYFFDTSNGSVGIGTVSPTSNIHVGVSGADKAAELRLDGTNGSSEVAGFIIDSSGATGNVNFKYNTGGGTPSTRMIMNTAGLKLPASHYLYFEDGNTYLSKGANNSLMVVTSGGWLQIAPQNSSFCHFMTDRAQFYFNVKINVAGNILPYSNNAYSCGASNQRFTNVYSYGGDFGGSVGIGTVSPETKLHVEGSSYTESSIKMERSGSGTNEDAGLIFSKSSTATDGHRLGGIYFGHSGTNYALIRAQMEASTGGEVYIVAAAQTNPIGNTSVKTLQITAAVTTLDGAFRPRVDSSYTLGQTSLRWSNVYADAGAFGTENKSPVQALGRDAYMLVLQRTTGDTDGGTLTENTWVTRELNSTQTNTISSASLSSYMISLPAGTYYARFWAGGYRVQEHQAQLYNNTDSSVIFHGTNQDAPSGGTTFSTGEGVFTLSGTKSILLRHIVDATYSTDAGGRSLGQDNITNYSYNTYAGVEIWKTS